MDYFVDKNPGTVQIWNRVPLGQTPLHNAAQEGHFDICELIVKYASDKNPI